MHLYHRSTGQWAGPDGRIIGFGYAGNGDGLNNPALQNVPDVGPLPAGRYTIGTSYTHPHLGPITMNLEPEPANEMFGRSAFRVHGRKTFGDMTSSQGCIVQDHDARQLIADSPDRELLVD